MYNQVIKYPYVPIAADPRYVLEAQLIQPGPGCLMTFCHIEVSKWSKSTLKDLETLWSHIRPTLPPIVYAFGKVDDAKWEKFVTRFGFVPLSDGLCLDGTVRRIFVNMVHNARQQFFNRQQFIY